MFRNLLFTIILFFGISLLTIPYLTGIGAEQQFSNFNQQIKLPASIKWVNSQYTRGWFNSQAKSVLSVNTSEVTKQPAFITLDHDIAHGLLPLRSTTIHSQLHVDSAIYPALIYETEQQNLVTVDTAIQANGQGTSQVMMPALAIHADKIQWQWQGLLGTVTFHQDIFAQTLKSLQTDFSISYFQFINHIIKLSAENMNFDIKITDQALPSGKLNFTHLQYIENNMPLEITDLEISSDNNIIENNNLTLILQSKIKQIQVEGKNYGPGHIDLEVRQLPIDAIKSIVSQFITDLQTDFSEQQVKQTLFNASLQHGFSVLGNKPELVVKHLRLNTPEGDIRAHFRIKLNKFPALALFNYSLLFNALEGEMKIYLPRAIVYDLANQLLLKQNVVKQPIESVQIEYLVNTWIDKKLFIEESGNYMSHFVLKQGILQINDQTFPLADLS